MSNLKVMNAALEKARNVKEIFSLDFVRDRAIKNYTAITGRKDGENWFASEVFAVMAIFAEKPKLAECDKMSIFACLVKAGTTGLSIRHGHIDLIPYGKILKAEPNYKGLRQQLRDMPSVKFVNEASLVMKDDEFEYDELNKKVLVHKKKGAPVDIKLSDIKAAYIRIEFTDKTVDTLMWNFELVKAKAKSKNQGEQSTWEQFPHEMSKKTVVKRANKIFFEPNNKEVVGFNPLPEMEITEDTTHEEVDQNTGEVTTVQAETVPQTESPAQVVKPAAGGMEEFLNQQ